MDDRGWSKERYSRQELFHGIGREGQRKLRESSVAIIGCGALGSLQAEILARAGVGRLILVDRDFVEPSNLQRQALYTEKDAEQMLPKAVAAAAHLREINGEVDVVANAADLGPDSASLLGDARLLMDGTDNFQTRYLVNDFAWKQGIPWVYGACVGSSGVAAAFVPDSFPCLRCVFESEPPAGSAPTCDTAGILWPAVGAVVSWQVTAALKLLTGREVLPQMCQLDVWENYFHIVSLEKAKRAACPTCGLRQYPALTQRSELDTTLCGRDAVQIRPREKRQVDLDAIQALWEKLGRTYRNPFLLKLQLEGNEIVLFPDGRAMIKGTTDPSRARDLYAKYVGN